MARDLKAGGTHLECLRVRNTGQDALDRSSSPPRPPARAPEICDRFHPPRPQNIRRGPLARSSPPDSLCRRLQTSDQDAPPQESTRPWKSWWFSRAPRPRRFRISGASIPPASPRAESRESSAFGLPLLPDCPLSPRKKSPPLPRLPHSRLYALQH